MKSSSSSCWQKNYVFFIEYHKSRCLSELGVIRNFGTDLPVCSVICSYSKVLLVGVPNHVHILVPYKKSSRYMCWTTHHAPFYATQQAQHKTTTTSCSPMSPWWLAIDLLQIDGNHDETIRIQPLHNKGWIRIVSDDVICCSLWNGRRHTHRRQ